MACYIKDNKNGITIDYMIDDDSNFIEQCNYSDEICFYGWDDRSHLNRATIAVFRIIKHSNLQAVKEENRRIVEVDNCQDCPFAFNDNEYGYYKCNISEAVTNSLKSWEDLPCDRVHELCPLKTEPVLVELKK